MGNKATAIFIIMFLLSTKIVYVYGEDDASEYRRYKERLGAVIETDKMEQNGFTMFEDHIFEVLFENLGMLKVMPALDEKSGRLALFFAREDDKIVYKTDDFETNNWNEGKLQQPNKGLYAIAFWDVNNDNLTDIILVQLCKNEPTYDQYFKTGDVLFQGESGFYRDRRISDTINRFNMYASVDAITAFVRDGKSTEFLYSAKTKNELLQNGFWLMPYTCFTEYFECFGKVEVLVGTFLFASHHIFMVYLVDEEERILWNFQPMGGADTFDSLAGISVQDLTGDGLKDLVIMAYYLCMDEFGEMHRVKRYEIYYQHAGYFTKDKAFAASETVTEKDRLSDVAAKVKVFWEW